MEDFGIARIFQELGHAIMTQKRSLYVLMSSCPGIAQGILSEKLSLLFGNFEVISVEPFDQKISREFIAAHLRDVKICKDLEGFIVDLTCGYPLYLKFICDEISSLGKLHQQNEIFLPLVQKAMENIVFNPWGVLHRHFDLILDRLCLGRGNSVYGSILAALSSGRKNLREIVSKVTAKKNIVSGKLNRLVEMGIIAKVGRYFYLEDKLFRFWIKYVYLKERLAFSPVNEEQGKVFCQELSAAYDAFLLNTHKDLSSRMVDLLQCCDEDSFCINGRRYKLPLFREVVPGKIQNDASFAFDVIKAKSAEGAWLIFLKAGIVGEQEIHSLLTASRGGKDKPKKFILISPVELDENARLKALQERMWIWNEGELKLFSSFYDKPFVF